MTFKLCISTMAFAAAAAALPLTASAQAYLGAGLGTTDAKKFCNDITDCDKSGTGWRVYGGYRMSRNVAVELGYSDFGRFNSNNGTTTRRLEAGAGDAAVLLIYPANQLSVFAKLGAYYANSKQQRDTAGVTTSATEKNGGLTYGLGAQYDFMQNLGVRVEWQFYDKVGDTATGGTINVNSFMLTGIYRFR